MENMFKRMNKRGAATSSVNFIIYGLLAIVLLAVIAPTIFTYLGTGAVGLGNTTANPAVPTWLPSILIIVVAIALVVYTLRAFGMHR